MTIVEGLTIFGLLAGPISSVVVSRQMEKRASLRSQRINLFMSLLATRTDRLGPEHLRSLSLIDVTFAQYPRVRQKWAAYYEALNNPAYNSENGWLARSMKFNDMLAEMARGLGYGKHIGFEEISRSYIPQGVADNNALQQKAQGELIRVLQNTENMGTPRNGASNRFNSDVFLAFAGAALHALLSTVLHRSTGTTRETMLGFEPRELDESKRDRSAPH